MVTPKMDASLLTLLKTCLYVGIGGGLGANARYLIDSWLTQRLADNFPYGTTFVNITGSFLFGLLITLFTEHYLVMDHRLRMIIFVGFLGSYTTFSTFEYETFQLATSVGCLIALLNVGLSVCAGFAALWFGIWLARLL